MNHDIPVKKAKLDPINKLKKYLRNKWIVGLTIALILITVFTLWRINSAGSGKTTYQMALVEKGTIISSIAASGDVSSANSTVINTQASGVVTKVYVKDGDQVKTGDKIAEIELDLEGRQRSAQAYSNYQSAKNSLDNAITSLYTLQSSMLTAWKSYMDIAQSSTYQNPDGSPKNDFRALPQYMSTNDDWLATEAKYKTQKNVIAQAQTSLNSTWLSYQQTSSTVYAPISGTVTGFSLQPGSVLTAQSNSSGGASSQKIANIKTGAFPTVLVNLTEIDIPKVKIGNKATITFDAFAGKTFTGQVISIDTVGMVSSGVTSYPTVIKLDTEVLGVLPNMSAQANIITDSRSDVLTVPSAAVQTQNGQATVRIMKNNIQQTVNVETGITSDSQTEIVSGLNEGDTVITGQIITATSQTRTSNQTSSSPFGAFGGGNRGGGFGGGGVVFRRD